MKQGMHMLGRKLSEETKRKISLALMGNKYNLGRKMLKKHKLAISRSLKGHRTSVETKIKISEAHRGKILSSQHRLKISLAKKGKRLNYIPSLEHREKIAQSKRGKKRLDVSGVNNHLWKADKIGYRSLHRWIENNFGTPKYCEQCKRSDKKNYHWANINHNYVRSLSQWKRLCVSCHKLYDLGKLTLHVDNSIGSKDNKQV